MRFVRIKTSSGVDMYIDRDAVMLVKIIETQKENTAVFILGNNDPAYVNEARGEADRLVACMKDKGATR